MYYLQLANGITWIGWIPGLLVGSQQGFLMPKFDTYPALFESGFPNATHRLLAIIFALGGYGPLIGALIATWMDVGRDGLSGLMGWTILWRLAGRYFFLRSRFSSWCFSTPSVTRLLSGWYRSWFNRRREHSLDALGFDLGLSKFQGEGEVSRTARSYINHSCCLCFRRIQPNGWDPGPAVSLII